MKELEQKLQAYLRGRLKQPDLVVSGMARIPGGASRETYRFRATSDGRERGLILRRDPPASLIETERTTEYRAYEAFHGLGLPVPEPIALELDAAPLERPASLEWPRIETDEELITLVSGRPLEWSARQAFRELLNWIDDDYDLPRARAALLLAMVAHARIAQVSNSDYTAYCVAPRDLLEPYRS